MIFQISILLVAISLLSGPFARCESDRPAKTVDQVIRQRNTLGGTDIAIKGFVRFDRLSRRGFLYRNLYDLRQQNYKKTIFLQLGAEKYSSLRIPDRQFVVVNGYLAEELRGPLGVYPAHVIVQRITPAASRQ